MDYILRMHSRIQKEREKYESLSSRRGLQEKKKENYQQIDEEYKILTVSNVCLIDKSYTCC